MKPDAVSVCSSIQGKISTSIHITLWSSIVCREVECVTFSIILSRQPNLKHFTVGTNRGQSFALAEQTHTVRPAKRGGGRFVCLWRGGGSRLRYKLLCGGWYTLLFHRGCWIRQTGHLYSYTTDSRFTAKLGSQVNMFPPTNGGGSACIEQRRRHTGTGLGENVQSKRLTWL